jgi:hypothetical protein
MSIFSTEATDRGVRQDFPLFHDVTIDNADIRGGFLKPIAPVVTHPNLLGIPMGNAAYTTNSKEMLTGHYYASATLTADRNLTLPSAASISQYLITVLRSSSTKIPGTQFNFSVDNTQAGAFSRILVGGTGVTLQGDGFDVTQNEIAIFTCYVHSTTAVTICRSNLGLATGETLAETLVAGNVTGGTNIAITSGDSITATATLPLTATGQLALTSAQAAVNAVRVNASNAAGGIDMDCGTGGATLDSTGGISLDAAAASNFSTTTGTLTLSSTQAAGGGIVLVSSAGTGAGAVRILASDTAGGIDVDCGTNGFTLDSTGTMSLDAAASSNVTTSVGTLTVSATQATGAGILALSSSGTGAGAVAITSAGGITQTYAAASTEVFTSNATNVLTLGTAAVPDVTANSGNVVLSTAAKGVKAVAGNFTIAGGTVTVTGGAVCGILTDSAVLGATSSRATTVTNSAVSASSVILIQVMRGAAGAVTAAVKVSVDSIAGGSFVINASNESAAPTDAAPQYAYWIINPV